MNLHFHRYLRACLVVLFVAASPAALNAGEKASIQFSCSPWEKLTMSDLLYRQGESYLPIAIPNFTNRSELYPLKGMAALELYTLSVDGDGKQSYKLMGKASLPPGTDRALFFIDEKKTPDGLPLTIFGLDDSLKAFPPGSFQFYNFTPARLQVAFGSKVRPLAPKAMKLIKSGVSANGGFIPFLIKDVASNEIIYETRLVGQPSGRDLVFIGLSKNPGSNVTVKFLSQIIPPAPAEITATQ